MNNKKKFFLVFLFIILDAFLLIGFLVIRDATMLNDLKKEAKQISKLDVTKDRFNSNIKTRGTYAVVEKAIKNYLDDYAVLLQEVLEVTQDEKLTKVLSNDNYKSDGPEFTKSLEYLTKTKEKVDKNINTLLKNSEDDTIKKYINDKTNDKYYRDLYVELILTKDRKENFKAVKELLETNKPKIENVFNTSIEILNFLKTNKDSWVLENGEIKFATRDLYNQYNGYVAKLSN